MSLLTPLAVPCYARVPRSASAHRGTDRPPVDGLRPCTPFTKQPPTTPHEHDRSAMNAPRGTGRTRAVTATEPHERTPTAETPPTRTHLTTPATTRAAGATKHSPPRTTGRTETGTRRQHTQQNLTTQPRTHAHQPHAHNKTNYEKNPTTEHPPQRTANEKNPHRHTASGASGLLYAPSAAPVRAVAPEDVLTHSGTRDARHTSRGRADHD